MTLLMLVVPAAAFAADQPVRPAVQAQSSGLTEINSGNVATLKPLMMQPIQQAGGFSGQLAAGDDRLYLQTPFPHSIVALDLARPGPPLWSYTPDSDSSALGLDCCSATIGGPVLSGKRIYANTLDGHTVALDATSGTVSWDVRRADTKQGETLVLPPLLIGDTLIVGSSGDDYGARGWIAALSTQDGRTLWKHENAGPDTDVGIGAAFKPPYDTEKGADLGMTSWPPDSWQHGGGGLASQPIYDPELNLLIYGTGHPAPWNPDVRSGDNKWTSGIFARDPKDGGARWFTPINPHDLYALGAAGSVIAADISWAGASRQVVIHPDANGMVYVLDRSTGAILAADAFAVTNATQGVDLASGALRRDDTKAVHTNTGTRDICPGWPGATGANGLALGDSAFAPSLGLLFIPVNGLCMDMEARDVNFISGTAYMGANLRAKAVRGQPRGGVIAWDVLHRRVAWHCDETFPVQGSVLATAGGIVFYGTLDGWFKALDAQSGKVLWQFQADSGIIGRPLSFTTVYGHQRIAVMSGIGGPIGRVGQNGIDLRDATAAHGFANTLHDLPMPRSHGGTLYVFGLP